MSREKGYLPGTGEPQWAGESFLTGNTPEEDREIEARRCLALLLDHIDYGRGACRVNESVGAVLPADILDRARAAHEAGRSR